MRALFVSLIAVANLVACGGGDGGADGVVTFQGAPNGFERIQICRTEREDPSRSDTIIGHSCTNDAGYRRWITLQKQPHNDGSVGLLIGYNFHRQGGYGGGCFVIHRLPSSPNRWGQTTYDELRQVAEFTGEKLKCVIQFEPGQFDEINITMHGEFAW